MLNLKLSKLSSLILVRGLGNIIYKISKYAKIPIFIKGTLLRKLVIAKIIIKVYIINSL